MINQYSIVGDPIQSSYNNQADYLLRIPFLINTALTEIRTTVKPQSVVYPLQNGEPYAGFERFKLPDDVHSLKTGCVMEVRDGKIVHVNEYHLMGKEYILVPLVPKSESEKLEPAEYIVEYYRYPPQIPMDALDAFVLDEEPDVIQAAVIYAAANLVLYDEAFDYKALLNDYTDRLQKMAAFRVQTFEPTVVEDVYGWRDVE